jgi:C-terminal processing protease CtpA/Prc
MILIREFKMKKLTILSIMPLVFLITSACFSFGPSTVFTSAEGVSRIEGEFTYTNEFYPEEYALEHAVMLMDMTGFVLRDEEWELPVDSQVLGYLDMDLENNKGAYTLDLPVIPRGELNNLDHQNKSNTGVQIFAVQYAPNWTHGPFYVDDDMSLGWPSYLASVTVDTENHQEVTGGRLLAWSPDAEQQFPTAFGEDDLLFTADDPLGALEAGYSVIDLDQEPFKIIREDVVEMVLYEPEDAAVKDFSSLSYTEAFEKMFEIISRDYAFNGTPNKAPNWDAIYPEYASRVEQAEQDKDARAFYLALHDLALEFRDGHVSISGDLGSSFVRSRIIGGIGLAVRETDAGKIIVVYNLPGSPADQAGVKLGAEITRVDGDPVSTAISKVEPLNPESTDYDLRYSQVLLLFRRPLGTDISFSFVNPGESEQSVTLTTIQEVDSFYATYLGGEFDEYVLPVEYRILDSGVGYVRINSNSDDLNLAYRIFQRALQIFDDYGVLGVVIDMRRNFGGAPLGLAGYLTDETIILGQLEYYNEKSGQFEPEGPPDKFYPMQEQYAFEKIVLLIDQFCYSACEIEAFGFSQVPGMVVMGVSPTAGVEAETARGKFELPEGLSFVVPTGRYTLPDGSIFLEGEGVQPTTLVPVTSENLLSEEDYVLQEAINIITQ